MNGQLKKLNFNFLIFIRPYSEVVNVFGRRTIETEKSEQVTTPATIPASAVRYEWI